MATYHDMCAYSAALRRLVRLPRGGAKLLPVSLSGFWTEHSERATIPTGLAILGHPKPERDMLGRWKPEGSDTYIRSYAGVMSRLQRSFAKTLRLEDRSLLLDEHDIIESAQAWIHERVEQPEGEQIVEATLEHLGRAILLPPQFEVPVEDGA